MNNETNKQIYCCACNKNVSARLTNGAEVYPHRVDLNFIPFWICDSCGNFVGCHHKSNNKTNPLGCIPTKEIKNARRHIHKLMDKLWLDGKMKRTKVYSRISNALGYGFHTANIKTIEEARKVYKIVLEISKDFV